MADLQLPLIVAGPILRRVEPSLVSVWVATSKPCKVRVDLFRGVVDSGTTGLVSQEPTFRTPNDRVEHTVKAGASLHIAVATARLPKTQKLVPDQIYSYNVVLAPDAGQVSDLRSLGLLAETAGDKPHAALGYVEGRLPSFSLVPLALNDLVLIHGSCRRSNSEGPDAMAYIDEYIQRDEKAGKPLQRPHLLVLTGDQIYADDLSPLFLNQLNVIGKRLVDGGRPEQLPILDPEGAPPAGSKLWKDPTDQEHWKDATLQNFPAGKRTLYCDGLARFTSVDREQHLLSFGEFAAAYAMSWCNVLWQGRPDPGGLTATHPDFVALLEKVDGKKTPWLFDAEQAEFDKKESERKEEAEKKLSPQEREEIKQKEKKEKDDHEARKLVGLRIHLERLRQFYDALPRVRRALANVPTLMMFDDHEVTDDWNIVRRFKDEVYARPAGRAIVRNALIAYALFQSWGNNPLEWGGEPVEGETDKQKKERQRRAQLLTAIDGATVGAGGWGNATSELDDLLDLRVLPAPADPAKAPVRWHYRYRAARFDLIALDSRTRRFFPGEITPAGLIDEMGLKDQIPEGPAESGVEAVLVLAACPVIGMSMMDEFIQPTALHVLTIMGHYQGKDAKGKGARLRARAKFLDKDPEPWSFEPGTFEALLARLEAYATGRPVLFLSGDVHYSTSAAIDYWKGTRATRFIQLTSSAFRNQPGLITAVDPPLAQRVLTEAVQPARLGWKEERPKPYRLPEGKHVPTSQLRSLNRSPLLLSADGWPEGTSVSRPPDWAWRYVPVFDPRPEADDSRSTFERRPAVGRGMSSPTEVQEAPKKEEMVALAERHAASVDKLAPRRTVFSTNMGVVRFAPGPDGPSVRHEIWYLPRGAEPVQGAQPHTVFIIGLKTPPSAVPPTLGAS